MYILKWNDGAVGFLEIQEGGGCIACTYLLKIWMQRVTIGCFVAWIANELLLLCFLCVERVYIYIYIQFAGISLYGVLWFFSPRIIPAYSTLEQKWKISLYKYEIVCDCAGILRKKELAWLNENVINDAKIFKISFVSNYKIIRKVTVK